MEGLNCLYKYTFPQCEIEFATCSNFEFCEVTFESGKLPVPDFFETGNEYNVDILFYLHLVNNSLDCV